MYPIYTQSENRGVSRDIGRGNVSSTDSGVEVMITRLSYFTTQK